MARSNSIMIVVICGLLLATVVFAGDVATTQPDTAGEIDAASVSYIVGYDMGTQVRNIKLGMPLDVDQLVAGVRTAAMGEPSRLSSEQAQQIMMALRQRLNPSASEATVTPEDGAATGATYQEQNRQREGVVQTDSGLQYRVVVPGVGQSPGIEDLVVVNYRGTLIHGTVFDSSFERPTPAMFPVARVIPGWTEALQLMKPGAKWELVIPSHLAYGESGSPPNIGPNQTLLFVVELLSILPPQQN